MSEFTLSQHHTLHDFTNSNPQFIGNVHIQSKSGENFSYSYPRQEDLDNGTLNFNSSQNGYAMISVKSPGTGMVALKSETPISIRLWADAMSNPVVKVTSTQIKKDNTPMLIWGIVFISFLLIVYHNQKKK